MGTGGIGALEHDPVYADSECLGQAALVARRLAAGARQADPAAVRVILVEAPLHRADHQVQGHTAGGDLDGFEIDLFQRAGTEEAVQFSLGRAASSSDQRFFARSRWVPGRLAAAKRLAAGIARGLADADQLFDQAGQALALGDLRTGGGEGRLGNGAGPGLAVDAGREDSVRAAATGLGLGAMAGGDPALAIGLHQRPGAQIAELGKLLEDLLAARFERGCNGGIRHT